LLPFTLPNTIGCQPVLFGSLPKSIPKFYNECRDAF
jgi:hypothetical protein